MSMKAKPKHLGKLHPHELEELARIAEQVRDLMRQRRRLLERARKREPKEET